MNDAVLSARTKLQLERFIAHPIHAILLTGPTGSGKTFIAQALAGGLLDVSPEEVSNQPYTMMLRPDKNGTIPIALIRDLQHFMQLRTVGSREIRRVVIIEHAHGMSDEAQNALLKLLEEPPEDTVLLLTAHQPRALLPTIRSRLQVINVQPPDTAQLESRFAGLASSPQSFAQNLSLSGNLPGLLHALLTDDTNHPLAMAIQQAKTILQADTFGRLAQVDALAKQKDTTAITLEALERIAQAGLDQAASKGIASQVERWHHILKLSHIAHDQLRQSVNAKLVLTNIMLQL